MFIAKSQGLSFGTNAINVEGFY